MSALDAAGVDTLLARLLWERGVIDLEVLQQGLAEARHREATLARLLVERGLLEEAQLSEVLTGALGIGAPLSRLGPYLLRKRLGQGGMGVVWLGEHEESGALVAVKTLPATSDPEFQQRFLREGEAQARVDEHANVVRVHSAGFERGHLYLVLDYAPGGDLAQRLEERGPFPPREAAAIARDLARGLAHVHAAGVLHRDLKPANVLFDEEDRPALVDFGLARLEGRTALTKSGAILGTPSFMAPEQARGQRSALGPETDVYGLGALLYTLLRGAPPFEGGSVLAILDQVLNQAPAPLSIDPELNAICLRCLEKDPKRRYLTASALAADLEAYLRGRPLLKQSRRSGALLLAVAALALLFALAAALSGASLDWSGEVTEPSTLAPLERGIAAAEAKDWSQALSHFDRALRDSPQSAGVRAWRGRALLELGREHEALPDLSAAFQAGLVPEQAAWLAEAWSERARLHVEAGQPRPAAAAWREALRAAPESRGIRIGLAWMQLRLGEFEAAREAADAALTAEPTSLEAQLLQACALRRVPSGLLAALTAHDEAVRLAEASGSKDSLSRALGERAHFNLYYLEKRYGAAEDALQAKALSPGAPAVQLLDAAFALKIRNYDDAEAILARLEPALAPNSAHFWYVLTRFTLVRAGQSHGGRRDGFPLALKQLSRGFAIDPWAPKINNELGWISFQTGDYERAEFHLSRAIQILPGSMKARRSRAEARSQLGDRLGVLEDAEFLLTQPEGTTDRTTAGALFLRLGLPARALRAGQAALALEASSQQARLVIAESLLQLGEFEACQDVLRGLESPQAGEDLSRELGFARRLEPGAQDLVRRTEELRSAPGRAAQLVRQALAGAPNHPSWWQLAAELSLAAKDSKSAIYASSRGLELSPALKDLHELRARALSRAGDFRAAAADLRSFLADAPPDHPKREAAEAHLREAELAQGARALTRSLSLGR